MKTICDENGISIYLFPDFIPVELNTETGEWTIGDRVITDIPKNYSLCEGLEEPSNWACKKYSLNEKDEWELNYYDDEKTWDITVVERKVNKVLKMLHDKDLLTSEELNSLYETDEHW